MWFLSLWAGLLVGFLAGCTWHVWCDERQKQRALQRRVLLTLHLLDHYDRTVYFDTDVRTHIGAVTEN
jgi:hypothetical protein